MEAGRDGVSACAGKGKFVWQNREIAALRERKGTVKNAGFCRRRFELRPVDRITIRDLTERAGINRCTFYHHYQDIYDLLEQIEDGVMEHVLEMMRGFPSEQGRGCQPPLFECFCQYIYENRTVYCV